MAKGPDEVTDKLFPTPENDAPARPLPLGPSVREEFLAHRLHFDAELKLYRKELAAALARLAPAPPAPSSVLGRMKSGAIAGGRYIGVALAVGEALAQVAEATGHPEVVGPIRALLQLFGGQ